MVMGRPEEYTLNLDRMLKNVDSNKKIFELAPISIPESQYIKVISEL
ncbi:hypothetical protein [Candidatus Mycoplasma mahonii]|nr:hypothetical protein [Candidatus Mycoplasma mahonii]WKX02565.1 hypothetical protein O3I44_00600 [Candidatus Mycoplasma mahonii]